ncbi:hypothetical protein HMPREF1544_04575 [Mucor circinelloides 1006PhL]|uniref:Uncharacterized protein n=1 Tax=Mucor circinelloides f. circinelloides (strain 1006PhL) TaxID=1220926 RepID=S2JJ98_MUCC1|nr:hypothetical protein HMPREF1544_04575 [Mucor circinelloides 1006PhL]
MKVSVAPLMMRIVTTRGGDKPNHWVTIKLRHSIKLKWPTIDKLYSKSQCPLFICAPLLLKEELTCEEDALLELSLSGIYNYLNPYMKKVYQEKLNRSPPSTIITTTTATNSVAEAMTGVRNLLDSEKDMDDILLVTMYMTINSDWALLFEQSKITS